MRKYGKQAVLCAIVVLAVALAAAAQDKPLEKRNITVDDFFKLKRVGGGEISPDGKWVAYTVSSSDLKEDRSETQVWMIPLAGGEAMQMTSFKGASAGNPKWSPDGKYLSFTASRGEGAKNQVWLLNRQGGEAQQLTEVKQGVQGHEWAPDSTRLVLSIRDPGPDDMPQKEGEPPRPAKRTQPPWVVDRLQFKQDFVGYLDRRRTHLYVFKLAEKSMVQITSGDFDDAQPVWSPDGKSVAFTSNRTPNPDNNFNSDIWVVAADNPDQGKTMLQLTSDPGTDNSPAWSPDSKWITYTTGHDDKLLYYAMNYLAVVPATGGKPEILTQKLDRSVNSPEFAPDGKSIYFGLEDSGEHHLARINLATREVTRPIAGSRSVGSFVIHKDGAIVARISERNIPGELFVLEAGKLRQLTTINNALMAQLRLAEVEEIHCKSKDGTEIEGWIYKPPAFTPGMKYPLLLRIHGGPASQYDAGFNFEAQLFAANGYLVVNMNPRGSTGYGQAFTTAIWADWGNKDYDDVVAGVEHAIEKGYADPNRLGVGGWSYGGILTNYVITRTDRFKGAVSGASLGLVPAMYGHDHYQRHYEIEIGLPWQQRDVWDKLSPFWKVEKITTPTLWICGEKDWNVPVINSEQMYIAMKRMGRETQLVVYPGEFHGINKPTYQKDRYERYLGWYDKYVKNAGAAAPAQTTTTRSKQ